jgi:hypothetical protein
VTGGLQHFPDSPERSVWIIPVGYMISLIFFATIHEYRLAKKEYIYMVASGIVMTLFSLGIFALLEHTSFFPSHSTEIE